ncbi:MULTISPECIES: glycosyltransferase family 9 protein [Flavobacterium]|uniref:glycosyltransferase family 9 protein n=1 Tax=Flavobacterium TaxID=237 RepID=UPI001FCC3610|nr:MULTISPECIES: glycosyltransferase family 9 protein [Flavobacterium]UOK43179.1 glycosyltransferase family 9 protein [Flavobacterium enshiense]
MSKKQHIAVIRLSAMGDVAMTVPVLRALVLQHPEITVTVVSRPFFKPFFDGIPNVSFFAVDLNKRHKGLPGLLRLYSDLRELKVDAVADLHNVLRSKVVRNLFMLSGKKVAATDKGRADKKALTRFKDKIFSPVKPMVERHADTFEQLGFKIDLSHPQFPPKSVLSDEIVSVIGNRDKKWVGIAPFAQYESKVYPVDLMQQLIDGLAKEANLNVLLFGGGEKEIQLLTKLKGNHSNVTVLAGKLKFKQELEVISNLDLMLSMDSGNAHIAAMLGVKVITLWGATHPYSGFKPFNQPDDFCLTSDREKYPLLPTSVYGNKKVEGYEDAMRSISPETVLAKIKKEL